MPSIENKRPLLQRLTEDASEAIADLIYEKVNQLLGVEDQFFTLEFPARPLNKNTYQYHADGTCSSLTKPITAQEAEFSLSDALYDTAPIIRAANGEKLSQNHLRAWLLTEVPDVELDENQKVISSENKISRMELCKKLYGIYLQRRNEWYKEKEQPFNDSKDNELNNFFNDVFARGNYHEVMTILGFLNVESPAETLVKNKQSMRACKRRSLDDSGTVYPVQFSPMNWFKGLEPNLHPKDLTMSTDALVAEYSAKKKALRNLEEKFAELEKGEISKEEIELRKENILSQINDIKEDLDSLSPLVSSTLTEQLSSSSDAPKTEEDEAQSLLLPQNSGDVADSNFIDVILTSESIQKRSEDTSKIEIGFRVMKASIDRGQWFSPTVFKKTQNFYHLSESICAPGLNEDDIRNALLKTDVDPKIKKSLSYTVDNKQCSCQLSAFPTAIVIAKNITIRVKVTESEMQENINYAESQNSSSGGLFGFSASSDEPFYVESRNDYIYIRIPGPQILGWFQQLVQ